MATITPAHLLAYLDDGLNDTETAKVEQALRDSESLRRTLRSLMEQRDRGEHSLGAIWRRQRLSCPTREQLGSYLLQALDAGFQDYIQFHLTVIGCPFCQANLTDLQSLRQEPEQHKQQRRQRIFESSAGFLQAGRETRK